MNFTLTPRTGQRAKVRSGAEVKHAKLVRKQRVSYTDNVVCVCEYKLLVVAA